MRRWRAGRLGIPRDTLPAAHAVQTEAYRRLSGQERTAIVFRLNRLVRAAAAAGIRARHPGYSEEQVHFALCRLLLGDALTRKVWKGRELIDP